ncbi:hypothetical protein HDV01_001300, partial [Terramyces sp. JEL0728]
MDDDFELPQLPPSLSLDELLEKAQRDTQAESQPLKQDEIPFDEDAVNKLLGTDDIKPTRKIKRDVKMTEQMLMGDTGFKYLIKTIKKHKFKGSGHEKYDLSKLMEIIQLWGHQMLPKMAFKDFLVQTNKICKQRRIKRSHFKKSMGILVEEPQREEQVEAVEPEIEADEPVVLEPEISTQQKEMIETKKQLALEKLARRQEERESARRREEEENIARMI